MRKYFIYLMMALAIVAFNACSDDDPVKPETPDVEVPEEPEKPDEPGTSEDPDDPGTPDNPNTPEETGNILIAYFSWGGTTARMAEQIAGQTGGTLFRIEPVNPYPTEYTPCTEVALEEKNNNARPAIKNTVENWDDYDVVFIGCPVWWWTTPMIIHTFCESYDFKGKTVVPFCTYASTYRDETLAEIVNSTADAEHLTGLGCTSSGLNNNTTVTKWLQEIGIVEQ